MLTDPKNYSVTAETYAHHLSERLKTVAADLHAYKYWPQNDDAERLSNQVEESLEKIDEALSLTNRNVRAYTAALHDFKNPEGREDLRYVWSSVQESHREMADILPAEVLKVIRDEHWGVGFERVWHSMINGMPAPDYFQTEVLKIVDVVRHLSEQAFEDIKAEART